MFENPKVKGFPVPVYVPGDEGELKLVVGEASLKAGTLVIEFNDRLPAQAIQQMMAKQILFGIGLIKISPEMTNLEEVTPDAGTGSEDDA